MNWLLFVTTLSALAIVAGALIWQRRRNFTQSQATAERDGAADGNINRIAGGDVHPTNGIVEKPPSTGRLPPNFQKLRVHTDWRNTWTHIVAGNFSNSHYDCILFYEGKSGFAQIYETDGTGNISILRQHSDFGRIDGRSHRWTHVVAGRFSDSPRSSLLLADQTQGFAAIFNVDSTGNLIKLREFADWGKNWSHVTTVRVRNLGSRKGKYSEFSAVLRYGQAEGIGEILECDRAGKLTLRQRSYGWRRSWSHVVGGFASGDSVLFYEASTGDCEIYRLTYGALDQDVAENQDVNELGTVASTKLPPGADSVVAGSFGWDASYALYFRASGRLQFVHRVYDAVDVKEQYEGLGNNWDIIAAGGFWNADEEDYKFGDGRFSSLVFYDRNAGRGEFYLHEPAGAVEHAPLAGYASAGSVRPGEAIKFFVSSNVGPYTIKIYRLGAQREYLTEILNLPLAESPLSIPRLSYRLGPRWGEAGSLQIPADWISGLYVASVDAGLTEDNIEIPFVVRAPQDGLQSAILIFVNDTTYEAYNFWGGRSLYGFLALKQAQWPAPDSGDELLPRGLRVSFRRPWDRDRLFIKSRKWTYWEEPLARWLARQGIAVEWATLVDLHKNPDLLNAYTLVVSTGHAEYFSNEMYQGLQNFISRGGNAAFFSGNNCYWRVRFEDNGDTMVCYKNADYDPRPEKTIKWTPRESGALLGTKLGGVISDKPEARLDVHCKLAQFVVSKADHWVFYNTGLQDSHSFGAYRSNGVDRTVVGYETDEETEERGPQWKTLASVTYLLQGQSPVNATMAISEGKGTTFTASTVDWTLGLSAEGPPNAIDIITLNIFRRLGGLGAVCDLVGFDAEGDVELDQTNVGWRSSWDELLPGAFVRSDRDQILLYDRNGGALGLVAFNGSGRVNLNRTDASIGDNWTTIVVGSFIGNARRQALLYDKAAGEVLLVGFDGSGAINLRQPDSGWRQSWDLIVAGQFIGNGRDQVLLYDRAAGTADIVGFDNAGAVNLDTSNTGWRASWDLVVSGRFHGGATSEVWLGDRSGNFGEVVAFDQQGRFRSAGSLGGSAEAAAAGDFLGLGQQQLLRYGTGDGDIVGFWPDRDETLGVVAGEWPRNWDLVAIGRFKGTIRSQFLVHTNSTGTAGMYGHEEGGIVLRRKEYAGWRTTWAKAVAGRFLGNGREQLALYDRGRI